MATLAERTQNLYNRIAQQYNDAFPVHIHPDHRELFISKLRQHARILDAGCAGGRDTQYFDEQGFNVTGVDFSLAEITYARSKYPNVDFREVDLLRLTEEFSRNEFEGIFSYATLDHLNKCNIPIVLGYFNRLLKMNGTLFIVTRKGKGVLWTDDKYFLHLKRRFTLIEPEVLKKLLIKKGFVIEIFSTFPSATRKNMECNLALCRKIREI